MSDCIHLLKVISISGYPRGYKFECINCQSKLDMSFFNLPKQDFYTIEDIRKVHEVEYGPWQLGFGMPERLKISESN